MERLREDAATRDLPVVVLTAKELSASEREFLQSQTDHVLQKGEPGTELLLPLVRRTVAESRARRSRS
jgi:CheY-like chemotaxis protein